MSDLHHDILERRLRAACREVIPQLAEGDEFDDIETGPAPMVWRDSDDNVVDLDTVRQRPRRSRTSVLVGAAAAAMVVLGGLAILQRGDQSAPTAGTDGASGSNTDQGFTLETTTVSLRADSIQVINGERSFSPVDARVESDPGDPTYTTLEITWTENGAEQRIFMYFASDHLNWWATEIRTYDTRNGEPDWYEPIATGPFFSTPLGTAFTGDVDLPNLHITGMSLQAFLPPSACEAPTAPTALVADYPAIVASPGDFGATLQVIDTASCTALPAADYTFEYATDDAAVATLRGFDVPGGSSDVGATTAVAVGDQTTTGTQPNSFETKTHILLQLVAPGRTTIRATARDAGGDIVGTTTMQITVTDAPPNSWPSTTAVFANGATTETTANSSTPRATSAGDGQVSATWRTFVEQELAHQGLDFAITGTGVGPGDGFSTYVESGTTAAGRSFDGSLVFQLSQLPSNIDTTTQGWQQQAVQFESAPVKLADTDQWLFVDRSNGVIRRVAVVTPDHIVYIGAEMIVNIDLPTSDILAIVAQDLSALADTLTLGG